MVYILVLELGWVDVALVTSGERMDPNTLTRLQYLSQEFQNMFTDENDEKPFEQRIQEDVQAAIDAPLIYMYVEQ